MLLSMPDFDDAQAGYLPLSVRDVKLQKSDVEWADIGGVGFYIPLFSLLTIQ